VRNIFLAHAAPDHDFAAGLSEFLEFGCDVVCRPDEGLLQPGGDLIDKAEHGLSSDVLVLLLSPASCPARWPRERWEPVLFEQARSLKVDLAALLLGECPYPALLRRGIFFDATANRLPAMRLLKRWIRQLDHAGGPLNPAVSNDQEPLYTALADRAGRLQANGEAAGRFARESAQEFEAVLWVPCHGRSLAQIAAELGEQLGLRLEGTAQDNSRHIREFLAGRRCLVVLDAPTPEFAAEVTAAGRTSTLITTEPVRVTETPRTTAYARSLAASSRYAEAYELFYALLDSWVDMETCARELTWICESWGRIEEANALRFQYTTGAAEQLVLF
jgi:hypothetical protein